MRSTENKIETTQMEQLFPGHFKQSEQSLKRYWETSIFVFDTNMLLNLYRYSDETRQELLEVLHKFEKRIWLPHWVAKEYFNNRLNVIDEQEKVYDKTKTQIESLRDVMASKRHHPFIKNETLEEVSEIFEKLCKELSENQKVHTERIHNDEIKDSISKLFNLKIGQPYEMKKLVELISDGKERYTQKTPPGYKDNDKENNSEIFSEQCRPYGDFIIWNQIIDRAMGLEKDVGVIFVSDDKKDDWWEQRNGKTICPRPELVKEFKEKTGQTLLMYQTDQFLKFAREALNEKVNKETVDEIREVSLRNARGVPKIRTEQAEINVISERKRLEEELGSAIRLRDKMQKRRLYLKKRLDEIESLRNDMFSNGIANIKEYTQSFYERAQPLEIEHDHLTQEIIQVEKEIQQAEDWIQIVEQRLSIFAMLSIDQQDQGEALFDEKGFSSRRLRDSGWT